MVGAVCAAAAIVGAGVLTVVLDAQSGSGHTNMLAGSGDAPSNTVFVQPSQGAMTMGATATFTTPSSVPPVAEATPPIKAGS